jgi:hypothetical protein
MNTSILGGRLAWPTSKSAAGGRAGVGGNAGVVVVDGALVTWREQMAAGAGFNRVLEPGVRRREICSFRVAKSKRLYPAVVLLRYGPTLSAERG